MITDDELRGEMKRIAKAILMQVERRPTTIKKNAAHHKL